MLDALQELTRLAVLRETGERSRLMLDIDGHRATRRAELTGIGTEAARKVAETGEPVKLAAMSPFERKVVHDAVAAAGLRSESEGEEPNRCVVVLPPIVAVGLSRPSWDIVETCDLLRPTPLPPAASRPIWSWAPPRRRWPRSSATGRPTPPGTPRSWPARA